MNFRNRIVIASLSLFVHALTLPIAWGRYELDSSGFEVAPPPAPGSRADQRDFETLHELQETRTAAACRAARKQAYSSTKAFFGPETGVLNAEELALVVELGDEIIRTVSHETAPFKEEYQRPRPYDVDAELEPCIPRAGGNKAYPSSHAAEGVVLADIFAEIFPAKRSKILRQGQKIGDYRVLGGVHHPTDVKAGRELGRQILTELRRNREFRRDMSELTE